MWTEEQRLIYRREGDGYPSDLRDAEWARLEPMIPPARSGGQPRDTDMRAAMTAILYLLRTGCPWRDRFPPRSTVSNIIRKFQRDGVWEATGSSCTWRCASGWGVARADGPGGQPLGGGSRQPIGQIVRK